MTVPQNDKQVIIEVEDGFAQVSSCPPGIDIKIIDHDEIEDEDDRFRYRFLSILEFAALATGLIAAFTGPTSDSTHFWVLACWARLARDV